MLGTHSPYKSVKSCTTAWMIKPEGRLFHQGYTNLRCFYTLVQTYSKCEKFTLTIPIDFFVRGHNIYKD